MYPALSPTTIQTRSSNVHMPSFCLRSKYTIFNAASLLMALSGGTFSIACTHRMIPIEPIEVPAGPMDLTERLNTPADATTALRGRVRGESVLLQCPCLDRPLRISASKGRFSVSGLPAGDYTVEIRGTTTRDTCHGSLAPGGQTLLLQGHIIVEAWTADQPRKPPVSPQPCELINIDPRTLNPFERVFVEMWNDATPSPAPIPF